MYIPHIIGPIRTAIGAALVSPEKKVMAITGDMGLWMVAGELGTAAEQGLDLVVVYLSDASLSLIELKQERSKLPLSGVRFDNPRVERRNERLIKAFE